MIKALAAAGLLFLVSCYGVEGPQGPAGPPGVDLEPDVVQGVIHCSEDFEGTWLNVTVWVLSDGSAIGICDLDEFVGSDTQTLIGNSCSLISRRLVESVGSGLIRITFTDSSAQVSGALVGWLGCQAIEI